VETQGEVAASAPTGRSSEVTSGLVHSSESKKESKDKSEEGS